MTVSFTRFRAGFSQHQCPAYDPAFGVAPGLIKPKNEVVPEKTTGGPAVSSPFDTIPRGMYLDHQKKGADCMSTQHDGLRPCMYIADRPLRFDQIQAAIKAMMDQARATSETPVCVGIVDASGNMAAFVKMDNARAFTRRHAVRKAYTTGILGINSGDWGKNMANIGQGVSENGDPMVTNEQGGGTIIKDGAILGGIGVGGLRGHNPGEDLAKIGLQAMGL